MANRKRVDSYQRVTDRILEMLDAGTVPWQKPWAYTGADGGPQSVDGRPYRGLNRLLLGAEDYTDPRWVTFARALKLGGNVRRGQKGSLAVFWKSYDVKDKDSENETKIIRFMRIYTLFNVEQCDNLDIKPWVAPEPAGKDANDRVNGLICMDAPPTIDHDGGDRAFYRPSTDSIHLPEFQAFKDNDAYCATVFHELVHSTGHASRLDRQLTGPSHRFGQHDYGVEELTAEFGAAFLCYELGIDTTTENHAAYIDNWKGAIKADKGLVVRAAAGAQKASDYVKGLVKPVATATPAPAPVKVAPKPKPKPEPQPDFGPMHHVKNGAAVCNHAVPSRGTSGWAKVTCDNCLALRPSAKAVSKPKPKTKPESTIEWFLKDVKANAKPGPVAVLDISDGKQAKAFIGVLSQVAAATEQETEARLSFQHVMMQAAGNNLRMVAADGFRMVVHEFKDILLDGKAGPLAKPVHFLNQDLKDLATWVRKLKAGSQVHVDVRKTSTGIHLTINDALDVDHACGIEGRTDLTFPRYLDLLEDATSRENEGVLFALDPLYLQWLGSYGRTLDPAIARFRNYGASRAVVVEFRGDYDRSMVLIMPMSVTW